MADTLEGLLRLAPMIPVLKIDRIEDAVPLARALVAGGLPVLEITLRTPVGLEAIRRIAGEVEGAVPAVGTVLHPRDIAAAHAAGARFAVSPGLTDALMEPAGIPLLPGAATASEVMRAMNAGLTLLKLFPAVPAGGVALLQALYGPLPQVRFCPTGGLTAASAPGFLAQPNVICVGGGWVAPGDAVAKRDWARVTALAAEAAAL
ncbi:MAG TPA: bifunctional 4-hydroxy-2-oxoglutarate aldolase/2-dehydro-3-deoxy-phosphogluconate aldolase [Caulobacteraceae bacterium]|jgi:2-dehydro-3-deoxyphosphogluconate aldolase/(4S)-4-hydroxy-2-oxoglutarate aldolase|nr:bifunctional 4-hydroxy-2-oxoglutarate aldolase/2-dehydro-3-deoxy-phosphogluconate aldolase [Caulobacteraceae bacterium]